MAHPYRGASLSAPTTSDTLTLRQLTMLGGWSLAWLLLCATQTWLLTWLPELATVILLLIFAVLCVRSLWRRTTELARARQQGIPEDSASASLAPETFSSRTLFCFFVFGIWWVACEEYLGEALFDATAAHPEWLLPALVATLAWAWRLTGSASPSISRTALAPAARR